MKKKSKWLVVVGITIFVILLLWSPGRKATATVDLTRVTWTSNLAGWSYTPSISGDGTKIAFSSAADLLDLWGYDDWNIWLYDTAALTYTLITTPTNAYGDPGLPDISGDGSTVAFYDSGSGKTDIWLYNTVTPTYTLVTEGFQADSTSLRPSLNSDGTVLVFQSEIVHWNEEIWVYWAETSEFKKITDATKGVGTNADVSADGNVIVFQSNADFIGPGTLPAPHEIWLYDLTEETYTRVTTASDKERDSYFPKVSADGSTVVFFSDSDFKNEGIADEQYEVWCYDVKIGALTRVTTASDIDRDSISPNLNADGKIIAFASDSDFLNQGISDEQIELWVFNRWFGKLERVTNSPDGNRRSWQPSLSADGKKIAFESTADFLNEGIPENQYEIWLASYDYVVYQEFLPFVSFFD